MKSLIFMFSLLAISITSNAQNIWTVNNQPNSSANFTTIQAAQDSATVGDIIMVQGSPFNYADITITKQLVIIGPGYFLGQNDDPFTQANPEKAYCTNFTVSGIDAGGTVVTGMSARTLTVTPNGTASNISDVIIQRCRIEMLNISYPVSATVKECYIGGGDFGVITFSFYSSSVVNFENNIIVHSSGTNHALAAYAKSSTFNHNLFIGLNKTDSYSLGNCADGTFTNNLILTDQDIDFATAPNLTLNNMTNSNLFDGVSSNISNVNAEDVIIGWADATGLSPDFRYTLKESSPAIDAANNGSNIGPFQDEGGYVLSGIPFVPNIYSLTAPDFGTNGSGITINIKAKANN